MKFNVYIDGFNLYKGALQKRPDLKWLDLRRYCQARLTRNELDKAYFVTSRIKEKFEGDAAPRRQHTYLRALENSGVEVVLGKFRRDINWQRLISHQHLDCISPNLSDPLSHIQTSFNKSFKEALPDSIQAKVWKYGEKGTDVNLASYLLRDVFKSQLQGALVITGDSDLATPLQIAHMQYVFVKTINPKSGRNAGRLSESSDSFEELQVNSLVKFQFPDSINLSSGKIIRRPMEWRKKEDPDESGSSA
jgi:uncharacterized LabA/DUF88 family protein